MQQTQQIRLESPSLPKGGGSIAGMGESLGGAGADGIATLSLPLPVSAGRGVAPVLSLDYSSGGGNSSFGMGWQCAPPSIRLRTARGVPGYQGADVFLAPSGEVLEIALTAQGEADTRTTSVLQGITLDENWLVTRYQPRILQDFSEMEYWQPETPLTATHPFWVMYSPDGQVHLFGKNAHARVANPAQDSQIAQWLLEESVSLIGEHHYYQYQAEDEAGCSGKEIQQHPDSSAQRYLQQVNYGNITAQVSFFALDSAMPALDQWLFHLVFDYGERTDTLSAPPAFEAAPAQWMVRPDCFSRFEYGFEIRTRRLCRQVLMFHRLQALAGVEKADEVPALVA
ncbi:MAG: virulence protein, partial [Burkholderiales bacterium]|nr:virulence protein [Burkholderiales bacterium]